MQHILDEIYERYRDVHDGMLADYIPELTRADPKHFGICVATVNREVYCAGDCDVEFSIQSISKPFAYANALSRWGRSHVYERVGVEPSGDAFNAIIFDEATNRPFNPMVNAGAIVTTALYDGETLQEQRANMLSQLSAAAGRHLKIDQSVYRSELETGHRNRGTAWLLRNFGMIDCDVDQVLDLYFQQCAVRVTARDLATMGATIANLGYNPITEQDVFEVESTQDVMSVMLSCGMYNFSGEWIYRVGIPAKSGVAGGILGIVNRQMGIGVYSPLLDERYNSVRGIRACEYLSKELGLHIFNFLNNGSKFMEHMDGHLNLPS